MALLITLPSMRARERERESEIEWCILITPTTQIELIETIANKSTCVRFPLWKSSSMRVNMRALISKTSTISILGALGKSGRIVTQFILSNDAAAPWISL